MKIHECIECPKCHNPFLKSYGTNAKFGKEYFCHFCHTYFGVNELVNQWNYDAGDLFDTSPWWMEPDLATCLYATHGQFSGYPEGEPYWATGYERKDAYQMVSRMFLDIPEFDDYADMLATQEDALGIGVQ